MRIKNAFFLIFFISGCSSTNPDYAGWEKESSDWSGPVSGASHVAERVEVTQEEAQPHKGDDWDNWDNWDNSVPINKLKIQQSTSTSKNTTQNNDSFEDVSEQW